MKNKGFIDLQVNGYLGVDFSEPGLLVDQVRMVTEELVRRGTIAYCPTVITSDLGTYEKNLPVLARAFEIESLRPHLLGIHLEGPFISPQDGARGAHNRDWVLEPSLEVFEHLKSLTNNNLALLTLSPEVEGAGELISHSNQQGITACLGHHQANAAQIKTAVAEGARVATHLGNGIPNELQRHPNPIWDQLAEESLLVSLITDGHHLPDSFIKVAIRAAGTDRVIVVSDSAPIAGYAPGEYETLGQIVRLEPSGKLWNPVGNHLVGSSANMMDCINYLASLDLLEEDQLWKVGYENPLRLLGREPSQMEWVAFPSVVFVEGQFRICS